MATLMLAHRTGQLEISATFLTPLTIFEREKKSLNKCSNSTQKEAAETCILVLFFLQLDPELLSSANHSMACFSAF